MPEDRFLALTSHERRELMEEASRLTGLAPIILEKDFWVCHTLHHLFSLPEWKDHLIFKGGTSLSKVYGLIHRFSEDVDISIHRDLLGFASPDTDPELATGKEQRRRLEALQTACTLRIRDGLLPALKSALENMGTLDAPNDLTVDPDDPQTLLYRYPRSGITGPEYLRPVIRIELGARSDAWPAETRTVQSYLGEKFGGGMGEASVSALKPERTFWEKATLLHAEAHRDPAQHQPARISRHYHDLASLASSTALLTRALGDSALRGRVVRHKQIYFRSARAHYEDCIPGNFKLLPPRERLPELERDHQDMLPMFFTTPLDFNTMLQSLQTLETRINS
ncbi:MAG: nucleotidyl transferase AbiEii/AbiGii toxin family protein [Verrucomicrobia bacterium]|nr:nucleotidyl transferase AbiEii/AbiGii toxin family protein [Verrucomicrobiota bacterium]MCH8514141.1 nucleotidyl transferase AbiEii/AbiGii toxin family protein [Kiritimatiellia bacterium]